MFFQKYLFVFMLIILLAKGESEINSKHTNFGIDCLIHNDAYRYEYLYSSNENKTNGGNSMKNIVNLIPLAKVNHFDKIRWSLIQTNSESEQFHLKSSFYGDYLCASANHDDFFRTRRLVIKQNNHFKVKNKRYDLLDNCKWTIKRSDSKSSLISTYTITNVFYDEGLYAASYFFHKPNDHREVFLSNIKGTNPRKFKWIIDFRREE
jgi:hypothetical protein